MMPGAFEDPNSFKSSADSMAKPSGIADGMQSDSNNDNVVVVGDQVNKFIAVPAEKLRNMRPWGDFLDYRRAGQPQSGRDLQQRFAQNVRHFESNYVAVGLGVLAVCLLTNIPLLLVCLIVLGAFMTINAFAQNGALAVGTSQLPLNYVLIGWLVLSIILLGTVSAFGTFFWALGLSACVVSAHACLYAGAQDLQSNQDMSVLEEGGSSL